MQNVIIAGVPRSGTTWLGELVNSSPEVLYRFQPLSTPPYNKMSRGASVSAWQAYFDEIKGSDNAFVHQIEARLSGRLPTFQKTDPTTFAMKTCHDFYLLEDMPIDTKFIFIIRSPVTVMGSWMHAPKEGYVGGEWREAKSKNLDESYWYGFYKWREACWLFHDFFDKNPDKSCIVHYEHLLEYTTEAVKEIYGFLNLPITEQTSKFITDSTTEFNQDAYSVYKGGKEDWLPSPEIVREIVESVAGTELSIYL